MPDSFCICLRRSFLTIIYYICFVGIHPFVEGIATAIMTGGKLCVEWTEFQDLAQVAFEDLRNGRDFTDITLACEDQSIKAHKVVLSACSPFFKKLLKADPHPQPLIYMRDMTGGNMNAILDFLSLFWGGKCFPTGVAWFSSSCWRTLTFGW